MTEGAGADSMCTMRILLWIALSILIGSYICIPVSDPDLWWHIVVGRWIIAHKSVPYVDYWNMFAAGHPWRAYSWSHEIIYALVDRFYGEQGLAIAQMIFAIVMVVTYQYLFGKVARNHCVGAVLGAYTAIACFAHFSLRPQTFVWMLFLAALVVADDIVEKPINRGRMLVLTVVGMLWANSHLTAILGLVGIGLWALAGNQQKPDWRKAILACGSFFLGTLITPYLGGEWITFFSKSGHTFQFSSIDEFKPAHILQFSSGFVVLQVCLLTILSFQTRRLLSFGRCLLCVGMLLAGMTAVKFLPFAVISLNMALAIVWRESADVTGQPATASLIDGFKRATIWFQGLHFKTIGALTFCVGCLGFVNIAHFVKSPIYGAIVPKKAVDFIETHNLRHPILNEFGSGGYLMYRFSAADGEPIHQVPIDGRTNVNQPAMWQSYEKAFWGREGWKEYIEKVAPKTIMWSQGSPFVTLLLDSPDWCRVFQTGPKARDYSVFILREDFEMSNNGLVSSDCRK